MDLVFFTPVRGHLSGDIFGLRKFLTKKKFFGLKKFLTKKFFGLSIFHTIFRLKKNFDEKFFGLGQFLKKKKILEFKILISILHLSNVTAIIGRQHG